MNEALAIAEAAIRKALSYDPDNVTLWLILEDIQAEASNIKNRQYRGEPHDTQRETT